MVQNQQSLFNRCVQIKNSKQPVRCPTRSSKLSEIANDAPVSSISVDDWIYQKSLEMIAKNFSEFHCRLCSESNNYAQFAQIGKLLNIRRSSLSPTGNNIHLLKISNLVNLPNRTARKLLFTLEFLKFFNKFYIISSNFRSSNNRAPGNSRFKCSKICDFFVYKIVQNKKLYFCTQ